VQIPDVSSWKACFLEVFAELSGDSEDEDDNGSGTLRKPFANQDQDQDQKQEKDKKGATAPVPPPEGLDLDAWAQWQAYRKLKPKSIPMAQRKLAKLGPLQADAVEHSIANGYQGLFAPKKPSNVSQFETHEQRIKREFLEAK
jgi:hypothetical protein